MCLTYVPRISKRDLRRFPVSDNKSLPCVFRLMHVLQQHETTAINHLTVKYLLGFVKDNWVYGAERVVLLMGIGDYLINLT